MLASLLHPLLHNDMAFGTLNDFATYFENKDNMPPMGRPTTLIPHDFAKGVWERVSNPQHAVAGTAHNEYSQAHFIQRWANNKSYPESLG